jgi:hypothetical protein
MSFAETHGYEGRVRLQRRQRNNAARQGDRLADVAVTVDEASLLFTVALDPHRGLYGADPRCLALHQPVQRILQPHGFSAMTALGLRGSAAAQQKPLKEQLIG